MSSDWPVEVIWERGAPGDYDIDLRELAVQVLANEGVAPGKTVVIVVTSDEAVRALNREFLGVDEPTDVLSFPYGEAEEFPGIGEEPLGELFIALPTVERQAKEYVLPPSRELAHVVVHGLLHLCGYDHTASPEDEQRMRAREEWYLGDLGPAHAHRSS